LSLAPLVVEGVVLGWSVAWPPGPINAEIMRRGLAGGFRAGFVVGLGAASGDALWAVATALGAGLLLAGQGLHLALGIVSTALLAALAAMFLYGAWRGLRARGAGTKASARAPTRAGYALGFAMALSSPWNLAFWLAVMGRPELAGRGLAAALVVAASVVLGALSWCALLCAGVIGLRLRYATPWWNVIAQGATGLLLLAFAIMGAARLVAA
jgi:threonine/homoserine/homoserine lactone efflux protein